MHSAIVEPMSSPGASDFDAFFRREHPQLVALALALTGRADVAADLAQDALVAAHRTWSTVGALDRPGAWARRVTINAATSWHRRQAREKRAVTRSIERDRDPTPTVEGEQFWRAVRALPERQRAAVVLHYLEDASIADVASTLDVTPGTVKASLFAARQSLAHALGLDRAGGA
jgi:RNA polymerase sigma-70 factor, ECF subfamily